MRRCKAGQEYYALPGGTIEPGESPKEAAVRELQEETSLLVTIGQKLGTLHNQGRTEHYFLAAGFEGQPELGGPEVERNCPENSYELEWVEADRLETVVLHPAQIRTMCIDIAGGRLNAGPWLK